MTDRCTVSFDWSELIDLFSISDDEQPVNEDERQKILRKINGLTDRYGREYVIRKIALQPQLG